MTATIPTEEDFPAAHSMDATWFAVDRDGHVGVFESGEPGAVPVEVKDSIEQFDHAVIGALVPLPVIGEPELELSAVFDPGLRSGELPWRRSPLPSGWPWEGAAALLLFQDESVLTSEVRALPGLHVGRIGEFVLVTLKPDVKLTIGDPRRNVWREFERVASAAPGYVTSIYLNSLELALARRGVFPYAIPDSRFGLPEPYRKMLAPRRPLVVDDAPIAVRDLLAARARLEVSFASSPYVQPAELIPCTVWGGGTYLASDGYTIRPLPGTEVAAYREQAAALLSHSHSSRHEARYKPLVFDPPLPTNGHFPAAHSMDATWFAVDRDGHIGVFDSGDPGAVPAEVNDTIGQSDDEVLEALEPLPVIGEPKFALSGVFHPGLRPGALPERRILPSGWPFVDEMQSLLLSDESLLTPEVLALPDLEVDRAGQFVLVSLKPTIELAQNDPRWTVWDQFKRVVYAGPFCISSIALMDPQLAVARRGLFAYCAHDARFDRPGPYDQVLPEPYGLVLTPKRPLRLDQAARPLRNVLATRARLNVAFASSPYIQPAELVPSVAWGEGVVYLASDGCTIRPFPATQAALYRQAGDLLRSDSSRDEPRYKPLLFDPPLDHGTS